MQNDDHLHRKYFWNLIVCVLGDSMSDIRLWIEMSIFYKVT